MNLARERGPITFVPFKWIEKHVILADSMAVNLEHVFLYIAHEARSAFEWKIFVGNEFLNGASNGPSWLVGDAK